MSLAQRRKELEGIRETLKPGNAFENIIIYDPAKAIPAELFNGDMVRIFIPDNGRNPGISQLC